MKSLPSIGTLLKSEAEDREETSEFVMLFFVQSSM
ncbi:unnamed protein product [Brassica oleracea]